MRIHRAIIGTSILGIVGILGMAMSPYEMPKGGPSDRKAPLTAVVTERIAPAKGGGKFKAVGKRDGQAFEIECEDCQYLPMTCDLGDGFWIPVGSPINAYTNCLNHQTNTFEIWSITQQHVQCPTDSSLIGLISSTPISYVQPGNVACGTTVLP